MIGRAAALLFVLAVSLAACFAGKEASPGAATANGGIASLVTARAHAGGEDEGPLGFSAPVSRSHLYQELTAKGIHAETLGPMSEIKDQRVLLEVMTSFTRALGVRCSWCHVQSDYAAPTARKAVAAFMWDVFVAQMQLVDGDALYCDSCHHQSTIFLHRDDKHLVAEYMKSEYVGQLRRRDGQPQGCATCHGSPFNARFLPRISDPDGWHPPAAAPGPQP